MKVGIDKEILQANDILRHYNWHFIHPYMQGYKAHIIIDRESAGTLTEEFVTRFFIENFYDLDSTLCFIDGFFKRSVYFEPFNYYIENSLILSFQRDYAGAINIIIPVIEGILANYMTAIENKDMTDDRYAKIKKAMWYLKSRLTGKVKEGLAKSVNKANYNRQKSDLILKQETVYFDMWFESVERFLKESLFANTNNIAADVDLNRHNITHSFTLKSYDTLENYIRLFNSLRFLIWAFLQFEEKSILNTIDNETFLVKRLLYESIIKHSANVNRRKHVLLKNYDLYPKINQMPIYYKSIFDDQPIKVKIGLQLKWWLIKMENLLWFKLKIKKNGTVYLGRFIKIGKQQ